MTKQTKIFLFLWFYVGWFGCVFLAKMNQPATSLFFPLVILIFLAYKKIFNQQQWKRITYFFIIGLGFDFILYKANLIAFPNQDFEFLPIWLVSIWILFVSTLPLMTDYFSARPLVAIVLGGILGPLNYYNGTRFGIVIIDFSITYLFYSLFWSIYFTTSVLILRKKYEN